MKIFILMAIMCVSTAQAKLSYKEYNDVLDTIYKKYNPVYLRAQANFVIKRSWEIDKVNAKARLNGSDWIIDMMGGYPKHDKATVDGFFAFACHEIGHHFGGFPYWSEPNALWASAEGQADYFVTTKCLRYLWANEDNKSAILKKDIEPLILSKCSEVYSNEKDYYLCVRSTQASREMLAPIAYNYDKISVATPYTWVTTFTFVNQHPGYQCRLDTFFQGALCPTDYREDFDNEDETVGACSRLNGQVQGARPRCWFLPRGF